MRDTLQTKHPRPGFDYIEPNRYCNRAGISRATFWRQVRVGNIELVRFSPRTPRVPVPKAAA